MTGGAGMHDFTQTMPVYGNVSSATTVKIGTIREKTASSQI
jgi:hypothetical protein